MPPKQIERPIRPVVKYTDFLTSPFKKLKILGSISSAAIVFIR